MGCAEAAQVNNKTITVKLTALKSSNLGFVSEIMAGILNTLLVEYSSIAHSFLLSVRAGVDCSGDSESKKLPVTAITKKIVTEDELRPERRRPIAPPYSTAMTFGTALGNHFFINKSENWNISPALTFFS